MDARIVIQTVFFTVAVTLALSNDQVNGSDAFQPERSPAPSSASVQQGAVVPGALDDAGHPWISLTLVKKMRWSLGDKGTPPARGNTEHEQAHPVMAVFGESMMSYKLIDNIPIKDVKGTVLTPDQLRLPAEVKAKSYTVHSGETILSELIIIREQQGATSAWEKHPPK